MRGMLISRCSRKPVNTEYRDLLQRKESFVCSDCNKVVKMSDCVWVKEG